jgi:hypothetical protein
MLGMLIVFDPQLSEVEWTPVNPRGELGGVATLGARPWLGLRSGDGEKCTSMLCTVEGANGLYRMSLSGGWEGSQSPILSIMLERL